MKKKTASILFLMAAMGLCFLFQKNLDEKRERFLEDNYVGYLLPSKIAGPVSLEFSGIVSDFLFLKASIFFGERILESQPLEGKRLASYLYEAMDIITDLDPWFWDAYLIANMMLSWDFNRVDLANQLLLKAREHRDWDFNPAYHLGFNHFYFLKDNQKGAEFLMEASDLPGAPTYLTTLAARLSIYENQYAPAIAFLSETLKNTQNPGLKKQYEKRLKALIIMERLERYVHAYRSKFNAFPETLQDLVKKGFIDSIPDDPYGGRFFLLENKRVYTSSKLLPVKKE